MPVDLLLVRHGLTDWNIDGRIAGRSDIALNEIGRAQIAEIAPVVGRLAPVTVLSSPQRRTRQTAEILGVAAGIAVDDCEELAEVWVGPWQGQTFDALAEDPDVLAYLADPTHRCDAIEHLDSVAERTGKLLDRLRADAAGPILLVSHGDPLRILVAQLLGIPIPAFRGIRIDTGSISLARLGRRRSLVSLLNWRSSGPRFDD